MLWAFITNRRKADVFPFTAKATAFFRGIVPVDRVHTSYPCRMNIDSHRISCYHTDVIEFCARLNDNAIFRIAHENQVCMLCQQFASPLSGRRCCWHFYIDNIANGRKDEAMTEYAPNLGHAVCFPVRKGIAAVNKDIM